MFIKYESDRHTTSGDQIEPNTYPFVYPLEGAFNLEVQISVISNPEVKVRRVVSGDTLIFGKFGSVFLGSTESCWGVVERGWV